MKYDFTTVIERRGLDALAIDGIGQGFAPDAPISGFDSIPMWVADMNFETAPSVTKAIEERIKHRIFGYFSPREEYFDSIIRWQRDRNGVQGLLPEHIGYENGVLGGLLSALSVFCSRGDNVLVHSPTYVGFTSSLENNGYNIISSPLIYSDSNGWHMDFEDMERKISENHIHAAIFCSPHNPCGRVWERWEIERAMEIYKKYDVYVVSDEIWSDIILCDRKHVPTQSVSDDARNRTVALYAPSKTFNLAGLVGSYHIIYNEYIRDRVLKESSLSHYNSMNLLSMYALIGGYANEGREWLEELRETLRGNVEYACEYIKEHFKGVSCAKPEGTYMLFIDCSKWLDEHNMSLDELVKRGCDVGVAWHNGRYHKGNTHIRINLALPLSRVKEAFARMDKYVFNGNDINNF